MDFLNDEWLAALSFGPTQLSSLRRLGEHRGKQELFAHQRPEVLETLRTAAMIESTESSNRLEGIVAPRARLRKLVLRSTEPESRSEQEIAGYRDTLQLIHESALDIPVTIAVILQLHGRIYRYLPAEGGRYKAVDNQIVERAPDGRILRIRFRPLEAVATPQTMEDLVAGWRRSIDEQQHDPLVLLPLFVLDFLCIHPFADGNGRVGRLLTLLLLYHTGYEVGRFISLERIVEESREGYYDALQRSSRGWHERRHDPMPWLEYFWGVLLAAYDEFSSRVELTGKGRGAKSRQVRAAIDRRITPFRISELERDCPGVSRDLIRRILRELRDDGRLTLEGRGPGARWRKIGDDG